MMLRKYSAFTETADGGNPAGVWIGDRLPDEHAMQRIAAEVGYSETAFIAPQQGSEREIRYFAPQSEVPFCGHATIASGVVLGETSGPGRYLFHTRAGDVAVAVESDGSRMLASFTTVTPKHEAVDAGTVDRALRCLHWRRGDLDPSIPVVRAYAGAWHLVIAVVSKERLDRLDYDFEALGELMRERGLTTLQLVWRESDDSYHSRNPFPPGGVVEDPATGAAAAAFAGYLRDAGLLRAPAELVIRQGEAMGRPSRIDVSIPVSGGIVVRGTAIELPDAQDV